MNQTKTQSEQRLSNRSTFASADTSLLDWYPGSRVRFAAPVPRTPFWAAVVAISVAVFIGYYESAGRANGRTICFFATALVSGGLTYWWMIIPERIVTLDWGSRTISIKHALLGKSLLTTGFRRLLKNPLRREQYRFDDIRNVTITSHLLGKGDPTDSDLYSARLKIEVADSELVELAVGWCDEDEATACKKLAPLARWFSEALDTTYLSPEAKRESGVGKADFKLADETNSTREVALSCSQSDLLNWGIERWQPGEIVRYKEESTRLTEMLSEGAAAAAIVSIGGAMLLSALNHKFEVMSSNLVILFCLAAGCLTGIGYAYAQFKPERSVWLDWKLRSVSHRASKQQHQAAFDDIAGLDLVGQYIPEKTIVNDRRGKEYTIAARWHTWLELSLRDGDKLRIANGRTWELVDASDIKRPSDESYRELLPIARELAESLDVPWRWKGFQGHETYCPPTDSAV